MKVRLLENSLRFRLRQPEVNQFAETGKVIQTTEFGPTSSDALSFMLEVTKEQELAVKFEDNKVTIGVPEHLAKTWISTDMVGFDGKIATGKGKFIDVLVEKDFACLDAPEEENIGAYPNPNAVC
jgi:hypothetical protein